MSFIATQAQDVRARIADRVRALGETATGDVVLRYRTDVWWAHRLR